MISAFGVDHGYVSKSLVGGAFKPISQLSHAERAGVGGYKKARGVSEAHQEFKQGAKARRDLLKDTAPGEHGEVSVLHTPPGMKAVGATYRLGSKKGGRSYAMAVGHDKKSVEGVMSHERLHAAPKRSEYRLHGQIIKDPVKTMREEARADVGSKAGHYTHRRKAARQGEGVSVYQASALSNSPKHLQRVYPHMSSAEGKQGIKAYKQTQDKILRAKGGKPKRGLSDKQIGVGGTVLGIGGITGAGALEHHLTERDKKNG